MKPGKISEGQTVRLGDKLNQLVIVEKSAGIPQSRGIGATLNYYMPPFWEGRYIILRQKFKSSKESSLHLYKLKH